MILVAGLAIAGLAGIAAAFYYSVRPGSSGAGAGARPGRARAARFAWSRGRNPGPSSSGAARSSSSARPAGSTGRRAAGGTGPGTMTGSAGADPTTGPGDDPAPLVADRRTHREAATGPRRRVAWRKATDVERELWPVETFGGVSDEQFWDDLAADKPLATTARTAPADSGHGAQPTRAYPSTRPTAADRTAAQPAVQPTVRPAAQPVQVAATPSPMATQAYPARTQPSPTASQPVRAAHQSAESRGRRSTASGGPGSDEDPLTSPAYSLRPKGVVDGRSYQSSNRSRDLTRGQYETIFSQETQDLGPGGTAAYPYRGQPSSQPARSTRSTSTPPHGDMDGHRNPVGPAGDPRRASGAWGNGRPVGNGAGAGEANWGSHRAHSPANGYRGPYDPWGNGRR